MKDDLLPYELAHAAQQKAVRARRRKAHATPASPTTQAELRLSPTQKMGRNAEERASRHLQDHGLVILGRNLRSKTGEIDLIANDSGTLIFIEVRHRDTRQYGGAAASVNRNKQLRLIRTANYFLPTLTRRYFRGRLPICRFDVVSIDTDGLTWIKNAFDT